MRTWIAWIAGGAIASALTACNPTPAPGGSSVSDPAPPAIHAIQVPSLPAPALVAALPAPAIETPIALPRLVDCRAPRADYDHLFRLAATRSHFWGDREATAVWLASIGCVESRYDNAAVSPAGARCVFQFIPAAAADYGVDVADPRSCIEAGGRYYAWQFRQWCPRAGSSGLRTRAQCRANATAAGNWGLGNLLDLQPTEGCLNWECFRQFAPRETIDHVARVERLIDGGSW